MKRVDWTDIEDDIVKSYAARGYSGPAISRILEQQGFTRSGRAVKERRQRLARRAPVREIETYNPDTSITAPIDAIVAMRDAATLGITEWTESCPRTDLSRAYKILSLSDLHMPFFHEGVLRHAFKHHGDADILVLNGDLLEMDMASRYPRHKTLLLKYEYRIALEWLRGLAAHFPRIILVEGNHEARLSRYFASRVEPGLNIAVEGDLLWRLSEGYGFDTEGRWEQKYDMSNVSYSRGLTRWFVQIGQAVFAHPWRASSLSMRSAENAAAWFNERGYSYQALIMGHTHRLGAHVTSGRLLIEQGCACVPLDYASRADLNYRPTSTGYAVAVLDKHGNVDFNQTRPYYYGMGSTTPSHSAPVEIE